MQLFDVDSLLHIAIQREEISANLLRRLWFWLEAKITWNATHWCLVFTSHINPPKKLLGSGFLTPYTPLCLICTISYELTCISHLYPFWVSRGWYPPVFSGRVRHPLDAKKILVRKKGGNKGLSPLTTLILIGSEMWLIHVESSHSPIKRGGNKGKFPGNKYKLPLTTFWFSDWKRR